MQGNYLKGTSLIFRNLVLILSGATFYYIGTFNQGFQAGPSLCLFNKIVGFPCPTCGLTRSLYSLTTGNLAQSIRFNPLGLVLGIFIALWALGRINVISLLKRIESTKIEGKTKYFVFAFLLLFWGFNVIRVVSGIYPR
jgi:hypothetical protein